MVQFFIDKTLSSCNSFVDTNLHVVFDKIAKISYNIFFFILKKWKNSDTAIKVPPKSKRDVKL